MALGAVGTFISGEEGNAGRHSSRIIFQIVCTVHEGVSYDNFTQGGRQGGSGGCGTIRKRHKHRFISDWHLFHCVYELLYGP